MASLHRHKMVHKHKMAARDSMLDSEINLVAEFSRKHLNKNRKKTPETLGILKHLMEGFNTVSFTKAYSHYTEPF